MTSYTFHASWLSPSSRGKSPLSLIFLFMGIILAINGCSILTPLKTDFDVPVTLELGQTIRISDSPYTITFLQVLRDARCPTQVECETHGPVVVTLALQHPDEDPIILEMNPDPALAGLTFGQTVLVTSGLEITLLKVEPYPASPEDLTNFENYEVTLSVSDQAEGP